KSNLLQFQGNSSLVKRVEGSTPVGGAILVGGVVGDVAGLHSLAAKAVYFPGCILVRHSNLGLGRAIGRVGGIRNCPVPDLVQGIDDLHLRLLALHKIVDLGVVL